ncbi:SARP family transcriptional regulator [Lentzea sp. NBRC 105346]|uniref:AfsR/SARP family transcriptional regulator n=1 Tax=Lentzea sp. NBRC 105346 TaxID=3032205 RepID=UPI0024A5A12A|nr:BTAD domain-containing putative transcriptional regulator [Lentzea sp. NBRC 105346]GLZ32174.1 SARP family transcriptional regulator [Lentzea sp. NBRC 105346]
MRIRLLGPFEVLRSGSATTPTAPKLRRVLALLAINANKVVRIDQLIDELWDDRPPISATTTLQTYVYQLRKLHDLAGNGTDGLPALGTSPNGYVLRMPEGSLDVDEFVRLAERGRAELDLGDLTLASATLREALDLWRGPALADVTVGPVLGASVVWFEELRKSVMEQRIDADLRLGRHHELIGELTGIVAEQPTHEGFQGKLMLALYRCGRRSEALRVYQKARDALADELGLEPSPDLQRLQQCVLAADTALDLPAQEAVQVSPTVVASPSQLPPEAPRFIGRTKELAVATEVLTDFDRLAPPVVVAAGAPGSGKSTFCMRVAHQIRSSYPDGQLYAELTTPHGTPVEPAVVLAGFLRAVGVPGNRIPDTVVEQARVFRSWTADRKVLVVLDDAVSMGQIAPLLPTGVGCATVIGSRRKLADPKIAATIALEPFQGAEGLRLLTDSLGDYRVTSDQQAVDELVELCDGLPLALNTAASQLELRPHWPISRQVSRMRSQAHSGGRLEECDPDMYASVWRTYQLMPETAQTVFRMVAPLGRPVSGRHVSHMLGTDECSAESVLEDLVQFQLAEVDINSDHDFSYRFRRPMREVARSISNSAGFTEQLCEPAARTA